MTNRITENQSDEPEQTNGCRITDITSDSESEDGGSTPPTRTIPNMIVIDDDGYID